MRRDDRGHPGYAVEFSDDLLRAIHRETAWSVPEPERPIHLDWRDRCSDLHVRKADR
ncbi:hypothetical protein [Streptomyces sp. TP-A0356]|uniref:hypothetical protein n=1 Tax=Streptomyces sp. TP-A0356 TaxID=1359208 RepID=UPI000AAEDC15|nr:hypothetical protein [Streptomyces sp. TP-A0356]